MAQTMRIGSKLPMPVRLAEPLPNPERPGDAPELRSFVINGSGNDLTGSEGVTENVDADLYRKWVEANPNHPAVVGKLFREIPDAEDGENDAVVSYGFEPGLKALLDDRDNTQAAADGSMVKDAGVVRATDMKPTSTVPNDDTPRSQTNTATVPVASVGAAVPAAKK